VMNATLRLRLLATDLDQRPVLQCRVHPFLRARARNSTSLANVGSKSCLLRACSRCSSNPSAAPRHRGHAQPHNPRCSGVYRRPNFVAEKKAALDALAVLLAKIVEGSATA
jgi:hypothetical protein